MLYKNYNCLQLILVKWKKKIFGLNSFNSSASSSLNLQCQFLLCKLASSFQMVALQFIDHLRCDDQRLSVLKVGMEAKAFLSTCKDIKRISLLPL